MDNMQIV